MGPNRRPLRSTDPILTAHGGLTSHAAVVARGMGRTCVCGAEALDVDAREGTFEVRNGPTVHEGDVISIDGSTGEVFLGAVPVTPSSVVRHFEGEQVDEPLVEAVIRLMEHADAARRMKVRTNADTAEDAARARRFGAQGIGLCRTEHMFLGDRRQLVENLIVADDDAGQEAALAGLLPLQREDFTRIFEAMDGLPVTIRLIDPPLHEFLPDLTELSVKLAIARAKAADSKVRFEAEIVGSLHGMYNRWLSSRSHQVLVFHLAGRAPLHWPASASFARAVIPRAVADQATYETWVKSDGKLDLAGEWVDGNLVIKSAQRLADR